jgi:DNA-binding NarL/FixJ family response regulator
MKTLQTFFSSRGEMGAALDASRENIFIQPWSARLSDGVRPRNGGDSAASQKQIDGLTSREKEVLQLVATGNANKQSASKLCISIKTVEKHRQRLTRKLGIYGTAGLTRFAIYAGII